MHPLAVITLFMGILLTTTPSCKHQECFNTADRLPRHQNVNVREQPSLGGRQLAQHVGSPLQQDHRAGQIRQGFADFAGLPAYCTPLCNRPSPRRLKMWPGLGGCRIQLSTRVQQESESPKQVGMSGLPYQELPLQWRAGYRQLATGLQAGRHEITCFVHAFFATMASKNATASFKSPYSKRMVSASATKSETRLKPASPCR